MIALLIALGGLFLAVVGAAVLDPWPLPLREDEGHTSPANGVTMLPN